jgi:hypothetical protein
LRGSRAVLGKTGDEILPGYSPVEFRGSHIRVCLFCQSLAEKRQEHGLPPLIAIRKSKLPLMAPHSAITQGVDPMTELLLTRKNTSIGDALCGIAG